MPATGCILVVEDDREVRDMLREYLCTHGCEVLQAEDGAAMRSEIERHLPDVVLLDVRLPGEDGLTLARYLRERYDFGIIMVTASGERSTGWWDSKSVRMTTSPSRLIPGSCSRESRASCVGCKPPPLPHRRTRSSHRVLPWVVAGSMWPPVSSSTATGTKCPLPRWSTIC